MANNKDFKVKNGIKPTAYYEAVGTVTSGIENFVLSNASYTGKSFSVSSEESTPRGIEFNSDGTKMYVVGNGGDKVFQYSLSTAYDVSTASYDSVFFNVNSQESTPSAVRFNNDGTKMFIAGYNGDDVNEYTMSTAYDIANATFVDSFSFSSQDTAPLGFIFNDDGTKMYIAGNSSDKIHQYSLSTAFDVSTGSYDSKYLDTATVLSDTVPVDLAFNSDGTKMFVGGSSQEKIFQLSLSTAYDVSTATYDNISFSTQSEESNLMGFTFSPDGAKFYIFGSTQDTVFQYSAELDSRILDLSTGSVFEITPTSDIQVGLSNPAASGTVSQATLLLDGAVNGYDLSGAAYDSVSTSLASQNNSPMGLYFTDDGTQMFMVGASADEVNQYTLSTAWDLSTLTYVRVLALAETIPSGIFFKDDGTKMYIAGYGGDNIYEHTLTTAWNISTGSITHTLDVSTVDNIPFGLFFKPDGTKMYFSGDENDKLVEYNLSTAWDLSTATFNQYSPSIVASPRQPFFTSDGLKVFIPNNSTDVVTEYSLSTAWDVSTLSYVQEFDVSSQETNPYVAVFKDDGTKMYVTGSTNDTIYQYSTSSAYTVTYDSTLQWGGGTAPDSPAANETDVLTFSTRDGGTTYQAAIAIDGAA
jgi:hypothetical protein